MAKKFLVAVDLAKNELQNPKLHNLGTDPSSPVLGQTYFNTTSNKIRTFNGTTWDEYGTSTATGNVTKAANSAATNTLQVSGGIDKSIADYAPGSAGLIKTTSAGVPSIAAAGTDYLAPNGNGSALTGITESQVTNLTTDLTAKAPLASPALTGTPTAPDPTTTQGIATKNYVDNAVQGLSWKQQARAIATTNITLSGTQTIDGVAVVAGDRVVAAGQTTASANGIYVVAAGAWSRALDADTSAELVNATIYVSEGTANADTVWTVTTNAPITVGTTSLAFAQVNGGSVPTATTSTAGKVQLSTQALAQAKADTTTALTPASVADFARKFTGLIGDGTSTSLAVTHGLGSQFITAQVFDATSNLMVECDITLTSTTQTTFTFTTAPTTNQYRVVIIG